jgi:uncharacterized membrane protein YqjE
VPTEKSIATILTETKEEIVRFITTRVDIFKAELNEKFTKLMGVLPLFLVAAAMLLAGWIALNFALIALLHAFFMPSVYAWLWASLIVGGLYMVLGTVAGSYAYKTIKSTIWKPNRTLSVLKQDQIWIQNEARTV